MPLWNLLADLEQSLGDKDSIKSVYDQMMLYKIINPKSLINYAEYLESLLYFEEAFRVYE